MSSNITSSVLILISLCFSLHACNARCLGVIDNEQISSSSKVAEKVKHEMDSTWKGSKYGATRNIYHDSTVVTQNPKGFQPKEKKYYSSSSTDRDEEEIISSGSSNIQTNKPVVSVPSWHVHVPPPKYFGDQHTGFHSDYARPRTRPPSHN